MGLLRGKNMAERNESNYGGLYRETSTFTGETVTNFACPTTFFLRNGGGFAFDVQFQLWEDVTDFRSGQKSIRKFDFNNENVDTSQMTEMVETLLVSLNAGLLAFLGLDAEKHEFTSLHVDSLTLNIAAEAEHKERSGYMTRFPITGAEAFNQVKTQYLETITLPLIVFAREVAKTNRDLKKFKPLS